MGLRRRALTNDSIIVDDFEVKPEAHREPGPSEQTRREDHFREWLADPKFREFAKRFIAESERTGTEEAGDVPSLDVPGLTSERLPFTGPRALREKAIEDFETELAFRVTQPRSPQELKELVEQVYRECEGFASALRGPSGPVGTLDFDDRSGRAELVPLDTTIDRCTYENLPIFEVVHINNLNYEDSLKLSGRFFGKRQSERFDQEWHRRASAARTSQMTTEQLSEWGKKASDARWEKGDRQEPSERVGEGREIRTKEAADLLGISEVRVRQLAQAGDIGTKVKDYYIFTFEQINVFKNKKRPGGRPRKNAQ
jgi:hypothetical protein